MISTNVETDDAVRDAIRLHPAASFGGDYLDEFNAVLDRYLVGMPGNVLEWGSGHTTRALVSRLERTGCRLFVTIDDNADYLREVLCDVEPRPWLRPIVEDRVGPKTGQSDPELAYATRPLLFGVKFDFIYIDGRRRMECALTAALLAHEETVVVIHDYRRGRYQPIRALFDVVEDGRQFRVLKARPELVRAFAPRVHEIIADVRGANPDRVDALFDHTPGG